VVANDHVNFDPHLLERIKVNLLGMVQRNVVGVLSSVKGITQHQHSVDLFFDQLWDKDVGVKLLEKLNER
jgi:hypothetical protein